MNWDELSLLDYTPIALHPRWLKRSICPASTSRAWSAHTHTLAHEETRSKTQRCTE